MILPLRGLQRRPPFQRHGADIRAAPQELAACVEVPLLRGPVQGSPTISVRPRHIDGAMQNALNAVDGAELRSRQQRLQVWIQLLPSVLVLQEWL
eukprot:CAMPEP_0204053894 /NCGR_PEP_ID=MMETSP0360-20130528/127544_1 /ASSEMBLY_ACC=CAM_ASM_000342 /TAXON_ID=268821 /ORGANISM="Scrippsiella Hangoei, Strain SHTV-5" /LENGTH=94 /DNA_ID=CAMNT_0051001125 /DNA_START=46 /DNA_END=327 /DNA_ORIENTATION=-